jgi:hypothetical protein
MITGEQCFGNGGGADFTVRCRTRNKKPGLCISDACLQGSFLDLPLHRSPSIVWIDY